MHSIALKAIALFIFVLLTNPLQAHPGHANELLHTHSSMEYLLFVTIAILAAFKLLKK